MKDYMASSRLQMELSCWNRVIGDCRPVSVPKGALLFNRGDLLRFVYIVRSGTLLQANTGTNGNEKILFLMTAGAICGETCLFEEHPQPYYTRALTDCSVYRIPAEDFLRVLDSDIETNHNVMRMLIRKLSALGQQLYDISFLTVYQRLAGELLIDFSIYAVPGPNGELYVEKMLTQQSLADRIGASRESVNRSLNQMAARNIIRIVGKRLCIMDPQALARIYGGDEEEDRTNREDQT